MRTRGPALAGALYLIAVLACASIAQNGPSPQGGFPQTSGSGGVTSIVAGTNVTISPSGGTGAVTINSSNTGGTVTSVTFTGDGTVLSSTPSTAVTTSGTLVGTLLNAAAHKWLGNNTGSTGAPAYETIGVGDLPAAVVASVGNLSPLFTSAVSAQALTFTQSTQNANIVFAGPSSGGAANPTFRALVAADMPAGIGTVTSMSTGNLSPLFTAAVATSTTTPALSFTLSNTANAAWFGATSATAPSFQAGALPISLGGTDNASLAVTAGGIVYTDGTRLQNSGAGAAGNVLTYPASGSVPIWQAPAGGTITSSTSTQIPVYTGATTIAGNSNFVYNAGIVTVGGGTTGGDIVIARGTGLVAQLNIQGNTSGDCQILAANVASSGVLTLPTAAWTGPTVTITEPTSLPSSTVPLTISSAGVLAPGTASTPGFGGDGSDGAITTWTKPLLNATTVTTSASTGPTTYGCIVVNSTGAQAYNSSAVINLNVLGYASPASVGGYASSPTSASSGGGPCGGRGAPTNALSAAGGGNGGAGGSGSALNGVGVGVAGPAAMPLGRLDMGSAGGQGSDGNQAQKVGGFGGGYAKLCAVGNITFASGSLIEANGGAGTAESSSAVACSGGGAGGTVAAFSQGTLTIAAGTVTCIGGAGGSASGSTTGYGGAGGGGGDVFGMSTSAPSNSLVTATACAGGAGGASGSSGNPGAAGSNGIVTMNTGTPNAPLISCMEHGGYQKWVNHLREYPNDSLEICLDEHGYSGHIDALVAVVAESPQEYVAFLSPTHGWGFGFDRLHQTEKVDKARREDVA